MAQYLIYILILLYSCTEPSKPYMDDISTTLIFYYDTIGEAVDVDFTDDIIAVAANNNGYFIFDIFRDNNGSIISVDSSYSNSDMDPDMGDNRAEQIIISDEHNLVFITDKLDKIWLYKLDGIQYEDPFLSEECYGGSWLNIAIDDQLGHINAFMLIKHFSAEEDTTFDEYSTSIVWKGLYDLDEDDIDPELNSSPSCEYSYNFGILPEKIYFRDGLLGISNGELGFNVLKQLDQTTCFDEENNPMEGNGQWDGDEWLSCEEYTDENGNGQYDEGEEFIDEEYEQTGDISADRLLCENPVTPPFCGFGGTFEPAGGFYPSVHSSFDLPGEVNDIIIREFDVYVALSNSNGAYVVSLDEDGNHIGEYSFADGYTINSIDESNNIIALAAGHDGILLYQHTGSDLDFLGQIDSPYSNKVRIDGNNIIICTEDGLYIYTFKTK